MPRYDEDVRNAQKTAERFERLHAKQAAEAATCIDEKKRHSLLFANWMISRRISAYFHFAECQAEGRHEVAHILNGKRVCTCGLITEVSGDDDSEEAGRNFATAEGHF
jgi:hypothetical protein